MELKSKASSIHLAPVPPSPQHICSFLLALQLLYPPHCLSECLLSEEKMSVPFQTTTKITTRHCGLRSCKIPRLERPCTSTRVATGRRRRKGTGTCARTSSNGQKSLSSQQRGVKPAILSSIFLQRLLRIKGVWFLIIGST